MSHDLNFLFRKDLIENYQIVDDTLAIWPALGCA
jgi:hypothetical protein